LVILFTLIAFLLPGAASGTWTIETVDQNGDFRFTSLALDNFGNPHISYQNYNREGLHYAKKDTDTWNIEPVDTSDRTGYWTALDLDEQNYPHVVYYSFQTSNLEYAWKNGSGWQFDNPPTQGLATWTTEPLKIGSDGYPRIVMVDRLTGELHYFWKNVSGWQSEIIPDTRYSSYPDLALDTNDQPHISYHREGAGSGDTRYATKDSMGWYIEVVDASIITWGSETAIRLDSSGFPRISYWDRSNLDLRYAWRDSSRWHIEVADSEGDVGDQCSLFLDSAGYPHISYYDTSDTALKYAWKNETGWHNETVEDGGVGMGWHSSLVLDSSDRPYISYGDYSNWSLKYAWDENPSVPLKYIITAEAHPGGSISPSGIIEVFWGESRTFNIEPDTGYHIDNVTVDGESVGTVPEYIFDAIDRDHTIEASFAIDTFTIVSSAGPGGTITPLGEVRVDYGSNQTFVITPDAWYQVSDIVIDGALSQAILQTTTFAMTGNQNVTFENVVADHTIHAEFAKIFETILEVQSDPPSASVFVDRQLKGITPLTLTDIPPGRHMVKFTLEGYQDWSERITVARNVVTTVTATLTPVPIGSISIDSQPQGALIILDANPTEKTTPAVLDSISVGRHKIELEKPGYRTWEKAVTVRANKIVNIQAHLKKG